jgi:hypothetical protein
MALFSVVTVNEIWNRKRRIPMKFIKLVAVFGAIVGLFVFSIPVMAVPPALTIQIQGIEISPGVDIGGNNYGATFVAQPTGGYPYKGALSTSINYRGTDPVPGGTNDFIGGSWSLTVTNHGKWLGTIAGKIPRTGGGVTWSNDSDSGGPNNGTEIGTVFTPLTVISATGVFKGIQSGTFSGADNHVSGIFIGSTQVPTVGGIITFYY